MPTMHRWISLALVVVACGSDDGAAVAPGAPSAGQGSAGQTGAGTGGGGAAHGGKAGHDGGEAGSGAVTQAGTGQAGAGTGGVPPAGSGGAGGSSGSGSGGAGTGVGGAGQAGQAGAGGLAGSGGSGGAGAAGEAGGGQAGNGGDGGAGAGGVGGSSVAGQSGAGAGGAGKVCGACPADPGRALWEEPTDEPLGPVKAVYCVNSADPNAVPAECWLTVSIGKAGLTATVTGSGVTFDGTISVWLPNSSHRVDLSENFSSPVAVSMGEGQGDACEALAPVKVTVTWSAPWSGEGVPVFGCSALGPSTSFALTVQPEDVHVCGKCDVPSACSLWDGAIAGVAKRVQDQAVATVRATLDAIATQQACTVPLLGLRLGRLEPGAGHRRADRGADGGGDGVGVADLDLRVRVEFEALCAERCLQILARGLVRGHGLR